MDSAIYHDGRVLPWGPNQANQKIKYRSIYRPLDKGGTYYEKSLDEGATWIGLKNSIAGCTSTLEGGAYTYHPLNALTLFKFGNMPGRQGRFGMYISYDGGDTFRFLYESALVYAVAVSTSDPKLMYGAAPYGSLLKSTDGGDSWRLVDQNDYIRKTSYNLDDAKGSASYQSSREIDTEISNIVIDPVENSRVYLATSKGLLLTTDGGETWCAVITSLTKARSIGSLVLVPGKPNVILLGTYKGLLRSSDRGCHWEWIDVLSRLVQ
jgi:hypothetical protein